jgi:predicted SprT family Zn-dependent metalloprotease
MVECHGCGLHNPPWRFIGELPNGRNLYQCRNCKSVVSASADEISETLE